MRVHPSPGRAQIPVPKQDPERDHERGDGEKPDGFDLDDPQQRDLAQRRDEGDLDHHVDRHVMIAQVDDEEPLELDQHEDEQRLGDHETEELDDQWTVVMSDGSLAAHFEETVAITTDGPEVLTRIA